MMITTDDYRLPCIGKIHSPFKEKFATPRQPGLLPTIEAQVEIFPPQHHPNYFRGLLEYSHIWLIFIFHHISVRKQQATVRPPRLGGNKRLGVFATRSMYRPNPIGLSCVQLIDIEYQPKKALLTIAGSDLIDGTPILDLKPYLPYSDKIIDSYSTIAAQPPPTIQLVLFSNTAKQQLQQYAHHYHNLEQQIKAVFSLDPRPSYKSKQYDTKVYGVQLFDFEIKFTVQPQQIEIHTITLI